MKTKIRAKYLLTKEFPFRSFQFLERASVFLLARPQNSDFCSSQAHCLIKCQQGVSQICPLLSPAIQRPGTPHQFKQGLERQPLCLRSLHKLSKHASLLPRSLAPSPYPRHVKTSFPLLVTQCNSVSTDLVPTVYHGPTPVFFYFPFN